MLGQALRDRPTKRKPRGVAWSGAGLRTGGGGGDDIRSGMVHAMGRLWVNDYSEH